MVAWNGFATFDGIMCRSAVCWEQGMAGIRALRHLMALFVLMTTVHSALAESPGPISEETPPAVCDSGSFLRSIQCTGRNCDNKRITCHRPFTDAVLGRAMWTPWFSEEQGDRSCPSRFVIAGLACDGKYCDSISLYCVEITNKTFASCADTPFVSEEQPTGISVFDTILFDASGQAFVATGLRCRGSYCDDVSLRVCEEL